MACDLSIETRMKRDDALKFGLQRSEDVAIDSALFLRFYCKSYLNLHPYIYKFLFFGKKPNTFTNIKKEIFADVNVKKHKSYFEQDEYFNRIRKQVVDFNQRVFELEDEEIVLQANDIILFLYTPLHKHLKQNITDEIFQLE